MTSSTTLELLIADLSSLYNFSCCILKSDLSLVHMQNSHFFFVGMAREDIGAKAGLSTAILTILPLLVSGVFLGDACFEEMDVGD